MLAIDFGILDLIQTWFRCGFFDTVLPVLTRLGDAGIVWIVLGLVLTAVPRTRRLGCTVLAALLCDLLLCNLLIKPLVNRPRPYALRPWISLLIPPPGDASFPSGHTAAAFASVSALFCARAPRRLWIPALALACIIAGSRLYLYVHYPSDVLGGAAIGTLCGIFGCLAVHAAIRLLQTHKTHRNTP